MCEHRQVFSRLGTCWGIFAEDHQTKVGTSTGSTLLWFGVEKGEGVSEAVVSSAVTNRVWEKLYTLRTSIAAVYYSPPTLYVNMSLLSKVYVFNFYNFLL